MGAIARLDD